LEEGSDSHFWSKLSNLFRANKNEDVIQEAIQEAKEDGELKPDEETMLLNVLRLSDLQVSEIMIPRTDMVCADADDTIPEIVAGFVESGHSRMPVYRDNRDNIIGVVHAKDLLVALAGETPGALEQYTREVMFVPETKNVLEMLQEFRARHAHMAIALDEYGGTSGLVTLEDVIEEIVGEIEDEHDEPRPEEIQPRDDGTVLLSGRAALDDLGEAMGLFLTSEQVETIGGYLSDMAGRVPAVGESFDVAGFTLTVTEADSKHIDWIVAQKTA
jgi:magnesium and cobalt transporter